METELFETMKNAVLEGDENLAADLAKSALEKDMDLSKVMNEGFLKGIQEAGDLYQAGDYFLPELVCSADAMKVALEILAPALKNASGDIVTTRGKVVLATVQGDIHDIGKNIVKVLLENYGYEIIDLGKDVPIELVVETAKRENIKMVGLSALMTTTVANMEKTIKALKAAGVDCVTAVGGAVLTEDYAKKIGADFYCKDAMDTVRAANSIFKFGK